MAWLEGDEQAAEVVLDSTDVAFLDVLFAPANITGERYPPSLMKSIDRD